MDNLGIRNNENGTFKVVCGTETVIDDLLEREEAEAVVVRLVWSDATTPHRVRSGCYIYKGHQIELRDDNAENVSPYEEWAVHVIGADGLLFTVGLEHRLRDCKQFVDRQNVVTKAECDGEPETPSGEVVRFRRVKREVSFGPLTLEAGLVVGVHKNTEREDVLSLKDGGEFSGVCVLNQIQKRVLFANSDYTSTEYVIRPFSKR